MFLRMMRRAERVRAGESGFAMVVAVAAVAIVSIIVVSIVSVTVTSVGTTTSTRALNQSQAAADTAIDYAKVALSGGTFYCTIPALSGFTYTATVKYYDASNTALVCSGTSTLSGVPKKAVVTSTGYAQALGVAGVSNGDKFTRIAILTIDIVSATYALTKSVFSDGGQTVTNNTAIAGTNADVYSNGQFTCSTSSGVNGNVFTQGSISVANSCVVKGTMWTGGDFSASSSVTVSGDLYAVGTASLDNTAWVAGSVVANNSITVSNQGQAACPTGGVVAKVCGNIVSFNGGVTFNNSPIIAGGVFAKGAVSLGTVNGTRVVGGSLVSGTGPVSVSNPNSTVVGGYVATGGQIALDNSHSGTSWVGNPASTCAGSGSGTPTTYPVCNPTPPTIPTSAIPAAINYPTNTQVVAPPRESLPLLPMESTGLAARWSGWTIQNISAADNSACLTALSSAISGQSTGSKVLLVLNCPKVDWPNNTTLTLKGDLAIMSPKGFTVTNMTVNSSAAGTKRNFMTIVPSDSPGVTWSAPIASDPAYKSPTCSPTDLGPISLNGVSITDTNWFMYTPCTVTLSNNWNGFSGQIYAGKVAQLPQNATMTMAQMSVPGVQNQNAVSASITIIETARFDKRG